MLREANAKMNDLVESIIERYQKSYEEGHIRCFLDQYIREMKKCAPLEGQSFTFQCEFVFFIKFKVFFKYPIYFSLKMTNWL